MENLCEMLLESAQKYPETTFVSTNEKNYTYREILHKVYAYTKELKEQYHIKANDKVVLYIENSVEYVVAYFSVLWAGAVVIPVNVINGPDMVNYIRKETNAALLIVSSIRKKLLNGYGLEENAVMIDYNSIHPIIEDVEMQSNEEALIIYTSGTTAKPKGVVLTHHNLIFNTDSILAYLPITNKSSVLQILSFTYSYGNSVLLTHTKASGTIIICNEGSYPQRILQRLRSEEITGFSTVGSYLNLLMKQSNFTVGDFAKLDYMTFAGEATSYDALIYIQEKIPDTKLFVMYGQTEASARISYLEPSMLERKKGSAGQTINGVSARIVDEDGNNLAPRQIGELIVKGENIMKGYYKDEKLTKETIINGWLHTGDLASMDEEGYLFISGRKKDIVKINGYRISPVEVESKINTIQGVLESAVVEEIQNGENVMAVYIVLKDDTIKSIEIEKTAKTLLPGYKRPKVYRIVDAIPKTQNGKIKRALLRKKGN